MSAASYRLFRSRAMQPLLQQCHALPTRTDIDAQLLGGSALFGAGWALGGFCPGPAVASLGTGLVGGPTFASAALFVGSFAVGSKLAQVRGGAEGPTLAAPAWVSCAAADGMIRLLRDARQYVSLPALLGRAIGTPRQHEHSQRSAPFAAQAGIVAKATATPTLSTASNSSPGRPGV